MKMPRVTPEQVRIAIVALVMFGLGHAQFGHQDCESRTVRHSGGGGLGGSTSTSRTWRHCE
jgi:hypothetical protein